MLTSPRNGRRGLFAVGVAVSVLSPAAAAALRQPPSSPGTASPQVTFDFVWNRIRDTYYDPGMRGLDWDAVRAELRPRAVAAESPSELRRVLSEMLGRLGESHFTIIPGSAAGLLGVDPVGPPQGNASPGLGIRWLDGAVVVARVREESPAAVAGIQPGWILESIAGLPVDSLVQRIRAAVPDRTEEREFALWLPEAVERRLLGPEGTPVRLGFRDGSSAPIVFDVDRAPPAGEEVRFGNLPPLRVDADFREEILTGGQRVGVVRWSAWFPAIVPAVAAAVDELRDAHGIVLDLRGNPGGLGALAMGIGGHFLDEPVSLGAMRTRDTELQFVVNPQRVAPDGRRVEPYAGPVAILVDPLTASTSEFFAAGLQALGRARVFGEPTAGQALPAVVVELPNGDRMMHVVADFTAPDGSRLEGSGVQPDVPRAPSRESLLAGRDVALAAALDWLGSLPGASAPVSGPR